MNKIITILFFIIFTFLITHSVNNNFNIINHGIVKPKITTALNFRLKRTINDVNSEVIVSIGDWILETHVNTQSIIFSNFTINWILSNDSKITNFDSPENCQVSQGHVQNINDSFVLMTTCDLYFYIIFSFNYQMFAVYPLKNGSHVLEETTIIKDNLDEFEAQNVNNKSVKVKRHLNSNTTSKYFNLTGDTFDLRDHNGPRNVEESIDRYKNQSKDGSVEEDSSVSYFSGRMWSKTKTVKPITIDAPQTPPGQWLELGVAVDYSVIEFHGERVQQYIFALLNIVKAIYKDPSLGANLEIVIVRIIFYIEKKNKMIHQGDARKSLENVNKWNRKILSSSSKIHDVAVWLTRLDIGGPSGFAPVSGVCDHSRSCALNRDEGLTSAFIIAHEIAHILGLTHDGDEAADNSCSYEASMGSVMAPVVAATFYRFHWSPCSRTEFYHRSKQWKCMNNPPSINNRTHLKTLLRETFTMDEQCRMEFGDGFEVCRNINNSGICDQLWCVHKSENQMCKTKNGPPLEGTPCGNDKWCINGYCEAMNHNILTLGSSVNNSVDGKWNSWSLWGKCSVTCGIGVRIRYRQCNNPTPFYGGKNCAGNSMDFSICKENKCPRMIDLRSEQCSKFTNLIGDKIGMKKKRITWIPYEHEDKNRNCRLTCKNIETGEIHISNDFLIDGTPCSYDYTNICIQGKCYLMGCDNIINSGMSFDQCGTCNGDNSTCISVSNKFQRKIRRATTRIAIVPPGSYDISVSIKVIPTTPGHESTKIVFRDAERRKHEISLNSQSYDFVIIVQGTKFLVQRKDNQYDISGRGPTSGTVTISLKISIDDVKRSWIILVNFHYITNQENEDSNNKYSWISGGWSPCTLSCGGGVRYRTVACRNEHTGRIVNRKKCLLASKPIQEIEKCNIFSCHFKWIAGAWENCTKTCGASGVQRREIYCVHLSFPDNYVTNDNKKMVYQIMVPSNNCNQYQPPKNQQECNRIPCQGNWIVTDWSPCTQTCGKGILQSRIARCVTPEAEYLFTCNGTASDLLQVCKNFEHSSHVCKKFCKRDKSRYCVIPNFKKYCVISEFHKRCCQACLN